MSYDSDCYCAEFPGETCVFCEIATDSALARLGKNLATAAALCMAYRLGSWSGFWEGACRVSTDDPDEINPSWSPGCGRGFRD